MGTAFNRFCTWLNRCTWAQWAEWLFTSDWWSQGTLLTDAQTTGRPWHATQTASFERHHLLICSTIWAANKSNVSLMLFCCSNLRASLFRWLYLSQICLLSWLRIQASRHNLRLFAKLRNDSQSSDIKSRGLAVYFRELQIIEGMTWISGMVLSECWMACDRMFRPIPSIWSALSDQPLSLSFHQFFHYFRQWAGDGNVLPACFVTSTRFPVNMKWSLLDSLVQIPNVGSD